MKDKMTYGSVYVSSVSSGAVLADGDTFYVQSGGKVVSTTLNSNGTVFLSKGAAADYTVINSKGGLHVYSGAVADHTTVNQNGYLGVGNGAVISNTTIDYAGALTVWGGGKAVGNIINTWGAIILSSGAAADSSVINSKGALHVYSGAVASNTTVQKGGFFGVGNGATTYNTTIGSAGSLTVWGGGVVSSNTINKNGAIILSSGALANDTVIKSEGGLHVYSGAVASNTTVKQGGFFGVGNGAVASNTTIDYAGALTVWGGGVVNANAINRYGAIILSSGALASKTVINSDGGLHVYSGAAASNTTVQQGGFFGVGKGASTFDTTIGYDGSLTVWGGGYVEKNAIGTWGALILSSGAIANGTDVYKNGGLHIYSGAAAYSTVVHEGASLGVGNGGKAHNVKCALNADVILYSGAAVAGLIEIAGSFSVSGSLDGSDCNFVFDVSDSYQVKESMLNSLAAVRNGKYIVKVGDVIQNRGKYLLAENAGSFSGAVSLVDKAGSSLGTLIVDGTPTAVGSSVYSLTREGGNLFLNVDHTADERSVKLHRNNTVISSASVMSGVPVGENEILLAENGGFVNGAVVTSGGALSTSAGALGSSVVVEAGGYVAADGGFLENTSVKSEGVLVLKNHGMAERTVVSGGVMLVQNSAVSWNTEVKSAGAFVVESSGVARNTSIGSGVYMRLSGGGSAVDAVVGSSAHLIVESGGVMRNVNVQADGNISIQKNGKASNVILEDGADAYVTGGAYVSGLECRGVWNRMDLEVNKDTYVQFVSNGKSYEIRDGVASDITIDVETYIRIFSGAVGRNLHTTGIIDYVVSEDGNGGVIHVSSGGIAYDTDNHSSGVVTVFEKGAVSRFHGDTQAELYLSGGHANEVTITEHAYMWVHSGGIAENVELIAGGLLTVSSGGLVRNMNIDSSYAIVEEVNGYITDTVVKNDGTINVCGGNAERISIQSGGVLTFSNSFIVMDGPMLPSPNGQARDIVISSGGLLSVKLTGSATGVAALNGGVAVVESSSELINYSGYDGSYAAVSGGGVINAEIHSGAQLTAEIKSYVSSVNVHSGGLLYLIFGDGSVVNGSVEGRAFSGADGSISGFYTGIGVLKMGAGNKGSDLTAGSTGYISAGSCTIDTLNVKDRGSAFISGGTVSNVHVADQGVLRISGKTNANNLTLQGTSAYIFASSGTTLAAADVKKGRLVVSSGASVSGLVTSDYVSVDSGARADGVTVAGGYAAFEAGATVSSASLTGGTMLVSGYVNALSISGGGGIVYSGGVVDGLKVNGGGAGSNLLSVYNGAMITGQISVQGATIYAESNAVISMDVSNYTGSTLSTPLISGLENIINGRFTITVSASQQVGKYIIARSGDYSYDFTKGVELIGNGSAKGKLFADDNSIDWAGKTFELSQDSLGNLSLDVSNKAVESAKIPLFEDDYVDLSIPGYISSLPSQECAVDSLFTEEKNGTAGWLA